MTTDRPEAAPLRRLIGELTVVCIGLGVAVGSGIFRTPGNIAQLLGSPGWIVLAWVCGGLFTLAAGLVTAELATRFPRAGAEYVFLRAAYGDFVAFFFGWAYTFFILGGGTALIAVTLGEAACELLAVDYRWAGRIGAAAVAIIVAVNCAGLRMGAGTQNLLTLLKVAALLALAGIGFAAGPSPSAEPSRIEAATALPTVPTAAGFITALVWVLWAYDGATDSAKMAEEIRDHRRALPRALAATALLVTAVYVVVNLAFLHGLSADGMAGSKFVAHDLMRLRLGPAGEKLAAATVLVICLGALASVLLACTRVTFALARDGLIFRRLAEMSPRQAPVAALLTAGAIAVVLSLIRGFEELTRIYFLAAAILFSLNYASLIVFRLRERRGAGAHRAAHGAESIFRCPGGPALVVLLIAVQAWIGWSIVLHEPGDAAGTVGLLALIAALYALWKRRG